MTMARDLLYNFVNRRGDDMARYGPPAPYQKMIEGGSDDDLYLHGLLNQVEDDRAHREAEKLRSFATRRMSPEKELVLDVADMIDPYETHDGELRRKSDGKPVII